MNLLGSNELEPFPALESATTFSVKALTVQDKLERIKVTESFKSLFAQPCGTKAQGKTGAAGYMLPLYSHIGLLNLRVNLVRSIVFFLKESNKNPKAYLK
ncbi:MAG: hypothetical protein AB7E52_07205 [Bdellovibrionales bacterium]